jgi:hypothetical protein
MQINKRLNLVVEVERGDGMIVHVHSTPVNRQIYERHYTFISKALTSLYADGMAPGACSRIAYLRMKELAENEPDRFKNVEQTLFAEIWRLTNVSVPTDRGWEQVPFFELLQDGNPHMDADDVAEVQNLICFFTLGSWVHGRQERQGMYDLLTQNGVLTTSSPFTEYHRSLPISNKGESSGATEILSSIPV